MPCNNKKKYRINLRPFDRDQNQINSNFRVTYKSEALLTKILRINPVPHWNPSTTHIIMMIDSRYGNKHEHNSTPCHKFIEYYCMHKS